MERLEQELKSLSSLVESLQTRISDVNSNSTSSVARVMTAIEDAKEQIDRVQLQADSNSFKLSDANKLVEKEMETVRDFMSKKSSHLRVLGESRDQQQAEIEAIKKQTEQVKALVDEMQTTVSSLSQKLEANLHSLQQTSKDMRSQGRTLQQSTRKLSVEVQDMQKQLSSTLSSSAEVELVRDSMADLELRLATLQKEKAVVAKSARDDIEQVKETMKGEVEKKLTKRDEAISSLQTQLYVSIAVSVLSVGVAAVALLT